jgi:glycosyltransferase involved in cell wall biosynthesis
MKIVGLMRVKNEARWITRCVESLYPLCDEVLVFDDHSTDGTPDLCRAAGAHVHNSAFSGIDEARDKDFLLAMARERCADWGFFLDGDEILEDGWVDHIRALAEGKPNSYTFRFIYLWDRENLQRVDGVYARMWRQSMFRMAPGQRFRRTGFGGNFHCGSVPQSLVGGGVQCEARIFHLGYLHREDRIRKYEWYNRIDPNNAAEDCYRHMVVGDLFPPDARFRHGGPLRLQPLE